MRCRFLYRYLSLSVLVVLGEKIYSYDEPSRIYAQRAFALNGIKNSNLALRQRKTILERDYDENKRWIFTNELK